MNLYTFDSKPMITNTQAAQALDLAAARVKSALPRFTHRSQNHSSVNNIYPDVDNNQWTAGFWPGQIWLSYLHTKEPAFMHAGMIQAASMKERIERKIEVDHHDMGFLYTPSCVAAWQITGDEDAQHAAIKAADQMLTRFQEKGGFFQAWGEMGARDNYRFIIDCLMNLPLLYWASAITGNGEYAQKADIHTRTCQSNSIRDDGSTYHTFFMDPKTGKPVRGVTCQGYKDDSSWARGQAWAIYGAALAYRHTGKAVWLETFRRVTAYFLSHLPDDLVPYWDLIFTDGIEPRDSSSGAIAACGLLDMADTLDMEDAPDGETLGESQTLRDIARQLTAALVSSYAATEDTDGLLLHGTYSKKTPYNTCTQEGVDECLTWGDYFYLEALYRLVYPGWKSWW